MQLSIHKRRRRQEKRRQTAQPACNPNPTQTAKTSRPANPQEVVVLSKLSLLQTKNKTQPHPFENTQKNTKSKKTARNKKLSIYFFNSSKPQNTRHIKQKTRAQQRLFRSKRNVYIG
jgi:hypothetical protein